MPSIIIEFNHEIFVIIFWRTIGTAEDANEKTTWFEKETHSHIKFYHNRAISGVLIDWHLCLVRVQSMEMMSRIHVSWETSTKWVSNLSTLWQKTNFATIFHGLYFLSTSKCSKICSKTTCHSTWILNMLTSFLWSIRVLTMENFCLFVNYNQCSLFINKCM